MPNEHSNASEVAPALFGSSSLAKAIQFLKLLASDDKSVSEFLERSFRGVTPDVIERWVKDKVELLPPTARKLYFENPVVAPWSRRVIRRHWNIVEDYLGRPETTIWKLVSKPGNAEVLSRDEVLAYVKKQLCDTYLYFKTFAWHSDEIAV